MSKGYVVVKCVGCEMVAKLPFEKVKGGEYPLCTQCFMPVVAVKTTLK